MLQQQWPWLTPSGPPPTTSATSHFLISYTLLLYLTSNIVSPCWCTSGVYLFFSVLKEKRVKPCGKSRDVLLFALQTLTSLLYFFLTQENKLVIIYCHNVNDYDHLFTSCTRCPPACLCVHERSVDSMTEWRRMWWRWYWKCVLLLQCWMFFFLSCPWEIHNSVRVCAWVCVCLLLNTYLLQTEKQISVKSDSSHLQRKGVCVWMCVFACLTGYCDG